MTSRLWKIPAWYLMMILLAGCSPSTPSSPHLDHAQSKLETIKLFLEGNEVEAEIARSRQEIATGMMFRQTMGQNEGMLFVYGKPRRVGFYMKNTVIPLSVAYMDPEGKILEIHDLQPLNTTSIRAKTSQIQFVLEMPQGWFESNQVEPGAVVVSEKGSLKKILN